MRVRAMLVAAGFGVAAACPAVAARPENACQLLPVVLDVEASGTRYRTEVSFTNASRNAQTMRVTYTPSLGRVEGERDGRFELPAGEQLSVPDGIEFLRQIGIGIPPPASVDPQAGTLKVCSLNPGAIPVGVMARVIAPTRPPWTEGNAGVSFSAVPADEGIATRATVFGLRRDDRDRSNVAVYNPGVEPVSVKLTLVSGSSDHQVVFSDRQELGGYGWMQVPVPFGALPGVEQGYVVVEKTSENGFFGAYGVVNDNDTNDGAFVPAVVEGEPRDSWTLPVAVDSRAYRSELTVANPEGRAATFQLEFVDSISRAGVPLSALVTVAARRQVIVPDVFDLLRAGIPSGEPAISAGTLRVRALEGPVRGVFVGVRVLTRQERGRFGVFAQAVPPDSAEADQGFLWGLRADARTRSNVAVLNAGGATGESLTLQLQAFDGIGGRPAGTPLTITLEPGQWAQPDSFFSSAGVAHGDVRIVRVDGQGPWWAYGVVNDGGAPGEGTGDGSFVPVVFAGAPDPLPAGAWGEPGVQVLVDGGGVAIETDCGHGRIEGRVFLDPEGRFNAAGSWSMEGGPTPVGGFPAYPALFTGQVEEDRLTLTVRYLSVSAAQELRLSATRGLSGQLRKCL